MDHLRWKTAGNAEEVEKIFLRGIVDLMEEVENHLLKSGDPVPGYGGKVKIHTRNIALFIDELDEALVPFDRKVRQLIKKWL